MDARRTTEGTFPPGSMWTANPILPYQVNLLSHNHSGLIIALKALKQKSPKNPPFDVWLNVIIEICNFNFHPKKDLDDCQYHATRRREGAMTLVMGIS